MSDQSSFGPMIRAIRLGYHWSKKHGSFIRLSTIGKRNYIEMAPADNLPAYTVSKDSRCWWDDPTILDELTWLRPVIRVKRPFCLELTDDGDIVREIRKRSK